jgi:hypothetical protein
MQVELLNIHKIQIPVEGWREMKAGIHHALLAMD